MTRPRIRVTRRLPDAVESRLRDNFDVDLNPEDVPLTPSELIAALQQADGLLATVTDRFDAETLSAGGRRRAAIVANFAVGYNNIDLDAARTEGVVVTNTPGVLTDATADTALLLMLTATRRAWRYENMLRAGAWGGFGPTSFLGTGLQDKLLGIVGFGRIGQAMARRGLCLGMEVCYFNRSPVKTDVPARPVESLAELMSVSDVVSLHMPGGGSNSGIISADLIARMKPTSFLINTARGDVVDEPALIAALTEGRIAGAGLDVFAEEPTVPEALRTLDTVSLLPHLGSATLETRTAMGMLAVDNLEAHFAGRPHPSRVA